MTVACGSGDLPSLSYPSSDVGNMDYRFSAESLVVWKQRSEWTRRSLKKKKRNGRDGAVTGALRPPPVSHAPAHFLPPSTLPPSQPVDVHMPDNKCGGDHGLSRSASPFFRWLTYYSRRWSSTWRSLPCPKHHFGRSCPPLCDDCSNADQVFGVMSERPQ